MRAGLGCDISNRRRSLRSDSMGVQMRRCVGVMITMLALALPLPALADAKAGTAATIYHAFTPHGFVRLHTRSKAGYCWEGALTTPRLDAWRCFVGNYILDPCFSSSHDRGIVLCPDAPWLKTGVKIRLTKPLPHAHGNRSAPSLHAQPWAIELYGLRRCLFASGASTVVEGQRLNYFCGSGS